MLHCPPRPNRRGVLVVVGGPQYRVGSHRQFVLLARALAQDGVAVLRFDYRGMGDSEGELRGFESIDMDMRAAIDVFLLHVPALREVVVWGLCDAAAAVILHAPADPRVVGLVLLNPWVHTEQGAARAYLSGYYAARLVDPNLWRKIGRGEFQWRTAFRSFSLLVRRSLSLDRARNVTAVADQPALESLPQRLYDALQRFRGRVLLILSGDDLTAREFKDMVAGSRPWRRLLREKRVVRRDIAEANHTFARRAWRDQVARWTSDWVRSW